MDQMINNSNEKYLRAGFEVSKRLAQAGYNLEKPACVVTWGQLVTELGCALVEQDIEPGQLTHEILISLVEAMKKAFTHEIKFQMLQIAHTCITAFEVSNPEDQEPDEGVLTEQYEKATRLGDEEGYWVDGGASADFFDD